MQQRPWLRHELVFRRTKRVVVPRAGYRVRLSVGSRALILEGPPCMGKEACCPQGPGGEAVAGGPSVDAETVCGGRPQESGLLQRIRRPQMARSLVSWPRTQGETGEPSHHPRCLRMLSLSLCPRLAQRFQQSPHLPPSPGGSSKGPDQVPGAQGRKRRG